MSDIKTILTKVKPSKKTLAIVATTAALILGAQSGVSMDELITSAEKIVPIINAIVGMFMGDATVVAP